MKDNPVLRNAESVSVVNCFQKLLSSWWRTTGHPKKLWKISLWIAFKNYYLRDEGQPVKLSPALKDGCELLSKIIIFVMKDNLSYKSLLAATVVNCFQKLLSSWWRTTHSVDGNTELMLWIAFKNYYLRDEGQRIHFVNTQLLRCELLSKIIIFVMKDNLKHTTAKPKSVVNCFQKLLSSWHDTTLYIRKFRNLQLWIAFKNYYLRDTTQLVRLPSQLLCCCELLSKIIIFVTRHNHKFVFEWLSIVVNCFQKLLSSWHDTTRSFD